MTRRTWVSALALLALVCLGFQACSQTAPARAEARLESLVFTSGGAQPDRALPLLIVIHGLGDRPEHFATLFRDFKGKARIAAMRAPDPYGDGFSWYPIDDRERRAAVIMRSAARVVSAAKELSRKHKTTGLPIVSGFSQGGVLSFAIAAQHPGAIRAAFPIAGALEERIAVKPSGKLPLVRAFHGARDQRIPLADGEHAVERLKKAGYDAELTRFEGLGHSVAPALRSALFSALEAALAKGD